MTYIRCQRQQLAIFGGWLEGQEAYQQIHQVTGCVCIGSGQVREVRVQGGDEAGELRGWGRMEEQVFNDWLNQLYTRSIGREGPEVKGQPHVQDPHCERRWTSKICTM